MTETTAGTGLSTESEADDSADDERGVSVTEEASAEEELSDLPIRPAIEAVLMVVDEPVSAVTLAQVLRHAVDDVEQELLALSREYEESGRGFELRNVAGGWRYYSAPDYGPVVERFVHDGQQARITQASLETLAVVAYRQPVSRARISAIRGVNVDGVMRTLMSRGLIEECGQESETGAHLYQTTSYFLERLGVSSLDELPELAPYLPELDTLDAEL